ncbi:TPA: hypothetical protein I8Z14_000054 [Legionella pneumophila]|nr:hypothetical protein [Legionella pneumophila]
MPGFRGDAYASHQPERTLDLDWFLCNPYRYNSSNGIFFLHLGCAVFKVIVKEL